ncbi:MAG: response regulator [Elusimicrobiota bacterium]|nr:response regulator [Elusimicrobiota bacterium]
MLTRVKAWFMQAASRPGRPRLLLLSALSVLLIAPTFLIASFSVLRLRAELNELTLSRRLAMADLTAVMIHDRLDGLIDLGKSLASRVKFQQQISAGRWENAILLLRSVPRDFPYVAGLLLVDPGGREMAVYPKGGGFRRQDLSTREWYQSVSRRWEPYVSGAQPGTAARDAAVVTAAAPIKDDAGKILGILALEVRADVFTQWSSQVEVGAEEFVYFVDLHGRVLGRPASPARPGEPDAASQPVVRKALRGERGVMIHYDPIEKEDRIAAYAPIPGYGWGVIATQSAREGFAHRRKALREAMFVMGLLILMSALLTVAVVRAQIKAESALAEARDAALELARVKSDFLTNMSHEIRTPMHAVIGMTRLLLDTPLTRRQREFAETVRGAGKALLGIIEEILVFSRIEAGRLPLEETDFDLRKLAEETLQLFAESAGAKGLELSLFIPGEAPTALRGDPGRLRQILSNLLSNAIKFTEQGEVAASVAMLEEAGGRVRLRLEVRDTGIGISPEIESRLFSAFSQADSSTTRKYGGSGLGLAISKKLVELMGGRIDLRSKPGEGSVFAVTLELPRAGEMGRSESYTPPGLQGIRVLAVDDNASSRRVLSRHLASWRMRCDEAGPAEAADALLRAANGGDPYRLVVLDMEMPGIDSLTLSADMLARQPGLKIVLMAPLGRSFDPKLLREVGADACLSKPVRRAALLDSVSAALLGAAPPTTPPIAGRPSRDRSHCRVLVVEDDKTNRKLAVLQLAALGVKADAASDGRQALEALTRAPYDLILMDCQMPDMDGFAATKEIRSGEEGRGRPAIVAMTAGVLQADRVKCLEAGMDDFLAKPVQREDLAAMLDKWYRPIDAAVLARVRELTGAGPFRGLIAGFLEDAEQRLTAMRAAAAAGRLDELERSAHALKGASADIGANGMRSLSARIEALAPSGDVWEIRRLIDSLAAEFKEAREALEAA